ncbi:hypothetical protein P8452_66274 [Trifolium repens]|nr:hypothetical protein QL285_087891 [Trifolium repens]WJX83623.1 hypothetical protein P8452_66274 [Trifolium repens]
MGSLSLSLFSVRLRPDDHYTTRHRRPPFSHSLSLHDVDLSAQPLVFNSRLSYNPGSATVYTLSEDTNLPLHKSLHLQVTFSLILSFFSVFKSELIPNRNAVFIV